MKITYDVYKTECVSKEFNIPDNICEIFLIGFDSSNKAEYLGVYKANGQHNAVVLCNTKLDINYSVYNDLKVTSECKKFLQSHAKVAIISKQVFLTKLDRFVNMLVPLLKK